MGENSTGYVVRAGEGPVWDMEVGRPAFFKLISEKTGGKIAVFEEIVPPGGGTPLHIHHTSDEVIHVIAGSVTFRLGEETQTAGDGSWIFVPLGSLHGWRNTGTEDARMFFIFTPGAGAVAFEEMRLEGKPIPDIDPATRETIFMRNGYETIAAEWG